jgi:hypothetical protein
MRQQTPFLGLLWRITFGLWLFNGSGNESHPTPDIDHHRATRWRQKNQSILLLFIDHLISFLASQAEDANLGLACRRWLMYAAAAAALPGLAPAWHTTTNHTLAAKPVPDAP